MPSEEADRQRATAHKRVAELIEPLVIAHVSEIAKDSSVSLEPLSRATPPLLYRVQWTPESDQFALLVYSTFGPVPSDFRQLERQLVDRVAVVQVISDIDDRAYDASGTDPLMDSLRAIGLREHHVVRMRLDEDMENQRQPPSWGWRALDELHLALLWLDQPTTVNLPRQLESQLSQEYTLLTSGNDPRMMTLLDAARAWLDEGHQTLLRAASLAPSEEALCAAIRQRGPVILSSNGDRVNGEEFLRSGSLTRLFASGKVIVADHLGQWGSDTPLLSAGSSAGGRSVVTFDLEDHYDPFYERAEAAAIHPTVVGVQSVRLARVLLSGYYDHAVSLLTAAAESGDSEAAAELAVVSAQQNRQESRRWQAKLIESGSLNDMNSAGDRLQELDMDGAITLYRAAAEAGDVSARTSLAVVLAPKDKEESRQWQAKLIESGSSIAMNSAGDRLQELDMDGAITLYRAAAEAGDVSARTSLAVVLAPKNKEESRHWQAKLIESGSSIAMNSAGDRLQEVDVDGAMSLYRTAAEEGNTAAMTSLAVMLAPKDKEESRGWQAKLMESGSTAAMDSAGDRLQEVDLDGAMSLYRTAADAGNTAAMTSLAVLLAPKDKEESRRWQAKLIESGSTAAMDIAGDRLQEVDPDGAITLYQAAAEAGAATRSEALRRCFSRGR